MRVEAWLARRGEPVLLAYGLELVNSSARLGRWLLLSTYCRSNLRRDSQRCLRLLRAHCCGDLRRDDQRREIDEGWLVGHGGGSFTACPGF